MIPASTALKAHLASEVTTLALCWKVTRKDGVTTGFTSFSRDLVVDGITYKASTGFTPTAIETSAGLAVDQLEVEAILNDTSITEADLQVALHLATLWHIYVELNSPVSGAERSAISASKTERYSHFANSLP